MNASSTNDPYAPYPGYQQQQADNSGWGSGGKPKIVPEPSTYGAVIVGTALLVVLWRRARNGDSKR